VPLDAAPPHTPDSRLGLTHERILDTALALLDREGLDGFSMRRLADGLGVGTMTIYGYFRTKDRLLDALVDHVAGAVPPVSGEGSWRDQVRVLVLAIRRTHLLHPAIVELRLRRPLLSTGALDLTEAGMRILRGAGFSRRDAARAYRTLFIYTFGFAAFGPWNGGEAERDQTIRAVAALPAERYPALTDAAAEAAEAMADERVFEFGLDRLLDGLETALDKM
jgi:AcrR family transcriptional regulator